MTIGEGLKRCKKVRHFQFLVLIVQSRCLVKDKYGDVGDDDDSSSSESEPVCNFKHFTLLYSSIY